MILSASSGLWYNKIMDNNTSVTPQLQTPTPNSNNAPLSIGGGLSNKPLLLIGSIVLLFLISVMLFLANPTDKNPGSTPIIPTVTPVEAPTLFPTSPKETDETETLKTQVKPQIDNLINISYTISKTRFYGNSWALIQITNPTTDPANLILKKENNTWKVILGPGTYFDDDSLQSIGAPEEVKQAANGNF